MRILGAYILYKTGTIEWNALINSICCINTMFRKYQFLMIDYITVRDIWNQICFCEDYYSSL